MEIVSSAELSISYDGEVLRAGLMDVQELAPALLASGTLIQKANALLNGATTSVSIKVRSNFQRGSFLVNLAVDQSLLEQAKNFLLLHPQIKEAKDILDTLFFYVGLPMGGVSGFFKLIKFLKNRRADSVTFEEKTGTVTLVMGDQHITVNQNTYKLYDDIEARRAAGALVAPVTKEGIDSLEIRRGDELEIVTKDDARAFDVSQAEAEMLLDSVAHVWLTIIGLSFNQEHKWRFSTGGSTLTAHMMDHEFWQGIHQHQEAFEEGDQLLVAMRTSAYRNPEGHLHTTYTVEKVIEHLRGPKQPRLDFK